ncbi:MAG: hypothetical protein IJJ26_03485 [Victivallales bacterium]|nr:hypothetical protein [Victivallales bacterium]
MRKAVFMLVAALCLCGFCQTPTSDGMPNEAWFDHVQKPTARNQAELQALTASLFHALKTKKKAADIAALVAEEQTPRAVFLTIGDDTWPARTYFGTGYSFRAALQTAVDIFQANEPVFAKETQKLAQSNVDDAKKEGRRVPEWESRLAAPGKWDWLRLDVVQYSRPFSNYTVQRSRIALTSIVGIAFGPDVGFAFTADQLTGRCLIDDAHRLARERVANVISEVYNWDAMTTWLRIASEGQGSRVCLFESDSFWTDGKETCRLYRGHRLPDALPTKEQCLERAEACGKRLVAWLDPSTGRLRARLPVWVHSAAKERETFDTQAELSIAFSRLAAAGRSGFKEPAQLALKPLLRAVKPYGEHKTRQAILENERLADPTSSILPRKIALLRTNALVLVALLELDGGPGSHLPVARALGDHILSQRGAGDDFYEAVLADTGAVLNEDTRSRQEQLEDSALAAYALLRLGKLQDPNNPYTKAGEAACHALYENNYQGRPLQSMVIGPWTAAALATTSLDSLDFVKDMIVAAHSVKQDIDREPNYPDYYGAPKGRPGCTLAAQRSLTLARLASLLEARGKPAWASEQIQLALPLLFFQSQAFLDRPATSITPSPNAYLSLFRDNLETYSFDADGQISQILSHLELAPRLTELPSIASRKLLTAVQDARATTDHHPAALAVELIFSPDNDQSADARSLLGGTSHTQETATQFQGKGAIKKSRRTPGVRSGVRPTK